MILKRIFIPLFLALAALGGALKLGQRGFLVEGIVGTETVILFRGTIVVTAN
ncbi:MAG: hypothetical protein KGL39_37485 [Patescibacteria group bacterium]|nr:hypothetical protein [Patescibacteria group bacterium]